MCEFSAITQRFHVCVSIALETWFHVYVDSRIGKLELRRKVVVQSNQDHLEVEITSDETCMVGWEPNS